MVKANDLKKGMVVEIDGLPYVVKQVEVRSPSSRGSNTLYKVRFYNLKTNQKLDETLKGEDAFKEPDLTRAKLQFSYIDGDNYVFMNEEDYSQYSISSEDIEEQKGYLVDGLEGIIGLLIDDNLLAIELPGSVVMQILETAPCLKGASATSRTKPAKLTTGIEIQVPEYLEVEEMIKINTATGKFMSRA